MATKLLGNGRIALKNVRIAYPAVFEAKSFDGETPKYMLTVLIPKSDKAMIKNIRTAIAEAEKIGMSAKWDGKKPGDDKSPLRDGDERENPEYHDHYYVNAKSNRRPQVLNRQFEPLTDSEEIYGGVWGHVSLCFYPYKVTGAKGIAASFDMVQKSKDDEPFGGSGVNARSAFEGFNDDDDEDDL